MSTFNIDGFQIDETSVGKGCSGEVFRAKGKKDNKEYAVKRYNSMSIDRILMPVICDRQSHLPKHEGILAIKTFQFDETPYYSVSAFDSGQKLSDCKKFPETVAWKVILRLAEALGHAHKFGLFHGNLHPGNVFYHKDKLGKSKVKVGDFGGGMTGEVHHVDLGDNAYFAPPEQLQSLGRNYHDGSAEKWDVYRFGAIAFWLLNQTFPRAKSYLKKRAREIAVSGGRPVPLDVYAVAASALTTKKPSWNRRVATEPRFRKYRKIIDDCLDLDPAKRPKDMREVRNRFRDLEKEFNLQDAKEQAAAALNEAENRVRIERLKQKTKLFSARAVAAILGASCIIATFYLVTFFKETKTSKSKITELDQLVANQKAHNSILATRWQTAMGDLKRSREAADASFYRMTQRSGGNAGASMARELERARTYYIKILREESEKENALTEKGRALHSLAHIEEKLSRNSEALDHFSKAIETFEKSLLPSNTELDEETRQDTVMRLADCHEFVGMLQPVSNETAVTSLSKAVWYFKQLLVDNSEDTGVALRLAESSFHLGLALESQNRFDEAISAYSDAALKAQELRASAGSPEKTRGLDEMISKLQFYAAESLRNTNRHEESIDAYIAAIESIERLRGVEGFSREQTMMMAQSFFALGNVFQEFDEVDPEEKDQVFNEALRLVAPIHRNEPGDMAAALLMSNTLSRLAQLELKADHRRSGTDLSVRGIEVLVEALRINPKSLDGQIQLAESRLKHLDFLKGNQENSIRVARLGIATASTAHKIFTDSAQSMPPVERKEMGLRLRRVFNEFGAACEGLGESREASRCASIAAFQISLQD